MSMVLVLVTARDGRRDFTAASNDLLASGLHSLVSGLIPRPCPTGSYSCDGLEAFTAVRVSSSSPSSTGDSTHTPTQPSSNFKAANQPKAPPRHHLVNPPFSNSSNPNIPAINGPLVSFPSVDSAAVMLAADASFMSSLSCIRAKGFFGLHSERAFPCLSTSERASERRCFMFTFMMMAGLCRVRELVGLELHDIFGGRL